MRHLIVSFIILVFYSCNEEAKKQIQLKTGNYRAVLEIKDEEELPFIFEVKSPKELYIYNAEEVIEVDEIQYRNDSVCLDCWAFDDYLVFHRCRFRL